MPQHELPLGGLPPINRLSIEVEDHTLQLHDLLSVTLRVGRLDRPLETMQRVALHGAGADLLSSGVGDIVTAWQFGTKRDVMVAAQKVERAARRHYESHRRA